MHKIVNQEQHHTTITNRTVLISLVGLLIVIIAAFILRFSYLKQMILHVDEFVSLLAIKMILEKGAPIHPTDIFDGKGLIFSYLGAGVSTLFEFSIVNIRYLSLTISIVTIFIVFWTARRLFSSLWISIVVAVFLAAHPEAILWGARARMYSLAHLLVFFVILVSWFSLHRHQKQPYFLFLLPVIILIALLSHLVTIVVIPAVLLAIAVTYWLMNMPHPTDFKVWRGIAIVAVAAALVGLFGYWLGQEPGEIRQWQEEGSIIANIARALFDLRLLENFYNYFAAPHNLIAAIFTLVGLFKLGIKAKRRSLTAVDYAAIFIYLQLFAIFLELYVFVPSAIRDERHNFIVLLPFLTLAMAYGALSIADFWQKIYSAQGPAAQQWLVIGSYSLVAVGLFVQETSSANPLLYEGEGDTYRYDQAMELVNKNMSPGDQLLSVMSPPAYLFANRPVDYYANRHKPRFIVDPVTGQRIDYYTGGTYLSSVEDFSEVVKPPGRLWFVVDEKRLTRNYSTRFSQEALHQMALYERIGNVLVLVERDAPWVMSTRPDILMDAEFSDQMRLVGYSTRLNKTDLRLTLFWKPLDPIFNYKVFVHLRDRAGNTVAQADFLPYDNIIHMSQWKIVWGDDPIPTGTVVHLPPELLNANPDEYRLYIGLYAPEVNSQRVPLTGDESSENAVILNDLGLKL